MFFLSSGYILQLPIAISRFNHQKQETETYKYVIFTRANCKAIFSGKSLRLNLKFQKSTKSQIVSSYKIMGYNIYTTRRRITSTPNNQGSSHLRDRIALEERQLRLQMVLEQRRQAASTEASTGTATPSTSGSATSDAVPDNEESRKSKGLEAVVFDMLGQCLVQSRGHFESFLRCVCYFTTMFFNKIYSLSY